MTNVVKLPERKDAEDAGKAVVDFVRQNPVVVIAGGVALGVAASLLLSRGGGRRLARHALTLAEVAGTASLALGRQARERAGEAGEGLRRGGEALAEKAGKLAGPAEDAVDDAGKAAQRLLSKAIELAGKLRG